MASGLKGVGTSTYVSPVLYMLFQVYIYIYIYIKFSYIFSSLSRSIWAFLWYSTVFFLKIVRSGGTCSAGLFWKFNIVYIFHQLTGIIFYSFLIHLWKILTIVKFWYPPFYFFYIFRFLSLATNYYQNRFCIKYKWIVFVSFFF